MYLIFFSGITDMALSDIAFGVMDWSFLGNEYNFFLRVANTQPASKVYSTEPSVRHMLDPEDYGEIKMTQLM